MVENFRAVLVTEDNAFARIETDRDASTLEVAEQVLVVVKHVQVRAADAAGQGLRQHFSMAGCWIIDLVNHEFAFAHYNGFHVTISWRK
jgi:hypothetical protein